MTLIRRSLPVGLISLIPIAFTLIVIYGFLGYSGIPLDYATMMIASVSIGVGIDYTIHFIHGIIIGREKGFKYEEAIKYAFLEKGKPILTNTFAVMLGFAVLILSSMKPLRHFGGVMVGSMFLAGLSALTFLPAFIILFKPKFKQLKKGGKNQ